MPSDAPRFPWNNPYNTAAWWPKQQEEQRTVQQQNVARPEAGSGRPLDATLAGQNEADARNAAGQPNQPDVGAGTWGQQFDVRTQDRLGAPKPPGIPGAGGGTPSTIPQAPPAPAPGAGGGPAQAFPSGTFNPTLPFLGGLSASSQAYAQFMQQMMQRGMITGPNGYNPWSPPSPQPSQPGQVGGGVGAGGPPPGGQVPPPAGGGGVPNQDPNRPPPFANGVNFHQWGQPIPRGQWFSPNPTPAHGLLGNAPRPGAIQQVQKNGRLMYRFELRDGWSTAFDSKEGNAAHGGTVERAEIVYAGPAAVAKVNSPYNVTPNTGRMVYEIDFNFERGFADSDHRWATLLQFHPMDAHLPGSVGMGGGFGGISVHGRTMDFAKPFGSSSTDTFARIPIVHGQDYKIRMDINWTNRNDGYIKVYNNDQLVGQYVGPTIKSQYSYIQQGYYRPGQQTQQAVVYQSPLRIMKP